MLTAFISVAAVSIPLIGLFCLLLLPQPVMRYRLKLGRRQGLIIIGAALGIVILLGGGLFADAGFILALLGLGFLMAEMIAHRRPVDEIIAYSCAAVFGAIFFCIVFYANISAQGLFEMARGYVDENLRATIALYEAAGAPEESIRALKSARSEIGAMVVRMLPSLGAVGLLFTAWLNLLAGRSLIGDLKSIRGNLSALNRWQSPDWLVWAVIAGIGLLLLPSQAAGFIGANAIAILTVIYFFQGIAVIAYFFEVKRIPLSLQWLTYLLIIIQQLLALPVAALGFLDVWADFRKLDTGSSDAPPEDRK
jgi:uncharacterized protein YybS (DUF2232 family)